MAKKSGEKVYLVVGVNHDEATVWTESFDLQGVFKDKKDADLHCDTLNDESDLDDSDDDDGMEYEVIPLDVLTYDY